MLGVAYLSLELGGGKWIWVRDPEIPENSLCLQATTDASNILKRSLPTLEN